MEIAAFFVFLSNLFLNLNENCSYVNHYWHSEWKSVSVSALTCLWFILLKSKDRKQITIKQCICEGCIQSCCVTAVWKSTYTVTLMTFFSINFCWKMLYSKPILNISYLNSLRQCQPGFPGTIGRLQRSLGIPWATSNFCVTSHWNQVICQGEFLPLTTIVRNILTSTIIYYRKSNYLQHSWGLFTKQPNDYPKIRINPFAHFAGKELSSIYKSPYSSHTEINWTNQRDNHRELNKQPFKGEQIEINSNII